MRTQTICRRAYSFFIVQVYKPYSVTAFEIEPIFKHLIYSGGGEREGDECIGMRMCG